MVIQQLNFPLDISATKHLFAFVHTEINEPSFIDSLKKQLQQSTVSKNIFLH
jgi:hypothetical protein